MAGYKLKPSKCCEHYRSKFSECKLCEELCEDSFYRDDLYYKDCFKRKYDSRSI